VNVLEIYVSNIRFQNFSRFTLYLTSLANKFLPCNCPFLIRTHMQERTCSIVMQFVLKKQIVI
jgi:hypothetical protein